jgi:2OG-Fe(II) oxygenase superfamily
MSTPLISVFDGFAAAADRRRLLGETLRGDWFRSPVEGDAILEPRSRARVSESILLPSYSPWAIDWLHGVERRLAALVQVDPRHLEPWQFTRYRRGGFYDYHLDCGAWSRHPSGERARTLMIILEAPVRGGATHFRALARTIRPVAGRLVVWQNLLPTGRCNHAMIHSGRPVWQGRKTILTTWERQRPYVDA